MITFFGNDRGRSLDRERSRRVWNIVIRGTGGWLEPFHRVSPLEFRNLGMQCRFATKKNGWREHGAFFSELEPPGLWRIIRSDWIEIGGDLNRNFSSMEK